MLKDHKLLIDEQCPLCQVYGQGFQHLQWIDSETIAPYQQIEETFAQQVDLHRASNEIALLHPPTGQTYYGLDALLHIITTQLPWTKHILRFPLIYRSLWVLYNFISYNRKVIAPETRPNTGRICQPDDRPLYRWAYIILVAGFTGLVLNEFAHAMHLAGFIPYHPMREWILCFGQVIWQGLAIRWMRPGKTMDYLGNMSTISLLGALIMLPVLLVIQWQLLPIGWAAMGFGVAVGFMLREHLRRSHLLGLPIWITASWLIYRLLFLLFLL